MTTLEKVTEIIADQMRLKASALGADTNMKTDIKADSLDVAQILFSLEDEFGVEIPTDKALNLETVGQLVELLDSLK